MAREKAKNPFGEKPLEDEIIDAVEGVRESTDQRSDSGAIENRFESYAESDLEAFTVRLSRRDKRLLVAHFKRRHLSLGQGIRKILIDYIERERLG